MRQPPDRVSAAILPARMGGRGVVELGPVPCPVCTRARGSLPYRILSIAMPARKTLADRAPRIPPTMRLREPVAVTYRTGLQFAETEMAKGFRIRSKSANLSVGLKPGSPSPAPTSAAAIPRRLQ
jgi:hypothetical protein